MTFTVERAPRHSAGKRGPGGAAVALGAVLALSLGAGEARAQAAVCTPTQTVSAAPDADGRYTTTLTCANTAAAEGAADYRHLHYNHEVYSETHNERTGNPPVDLAVGTFTNPADRDTSLANNAANNNLAFTVESGVVFTADGGTDTKLVPRDGAIVLWGGGAKTVRIEKGATINLKRVTGPRSSNYPHWFRDILGNFGGIYAWSETSTGGGVTVLHEGKINSGIRTSFGGYESNTGAVIVAVIEDDDSSETRADADIRVDLASTGVIEQVAHSSTLGSHSLGGMYLQSWAEEGDIAVNLARGSRIDLSARGGNPAIHAVISTSSNQHGDPTGNITVNAAGTISNRITARALSGWQGMGVRIENSGKGSTRIESSGTIETVQGAGIFASVHSSENEQRDDPATSRIEGNLIDVTSGSIVTRANPAIQVRSGGAASWTVRVAEGATVRSEFDGGPSAIPQATLRHDGGIHYVFPGFGNARNWRRIDANNDGNFGNTGDLLEPYVHAIAITRASDAEDGAVDHAIVDGTAQTVGGRHGDGAIFFERGSAAVTVGPTGRVISDSGVAIASGQTPAALQAATTGGLSVTVARGGRVTGDIRVLNDGDLNATVAGTVDGDLRTLGDGDLYATVSGTVTGEIRTVGAGDLTVTVAEGGRLAASALHTARGDLDLTVAGRLTGDLSPPRYGALTLSVLEGGVVPGTVRDPADTLTVAGDVGRVFYSNGGKITVEATGRITGGETDSGTAAPPGSGGGTDLPPIVPVVDALYSVSGTLDVTVAGRVASDLRPPAGGTLKLSVLKGGVVEGTVHDPEGPLTVAGGIERLLYSNGGEVTVAATGALTGVWTSRGTEALRSVRGTLDATVAGRVAGDLRPPAGGTLKLSVPEGGVVEGTVHDPEGPLTVAGSIGRLFYSNGGEATIGATGALTGVEANGRIEALRSENGDLRVTVAGRAVGDILGLGDGEHDVIVRPGGAVTGAIRLAASTAQVDGAAGAVFLDRGGAVAVGPEGRIAGVGGVGIRSAAGDFTATVEGVVVGNIHALGDGARTVDIQPGGVVTGNVYVPDGDSAGAAAVSVARGARITGEVEVPRAENIELDGAVGKVSAVRGGVLTVGPDGRVTGTDDDTPDVSSETGELTVVIQLARGETEADAVMRRAPRRIRDVSGDGRVLYRMPDSDELRELGAFASGYSTPSGPFDVGLVMGGSGIEPKVRYAPRAQVYEALPSVLLGLNEPSGFRARMAAPRASNGMWARTQAWTGARDAKRSTSALPGRTISLKHRGYGLEAGMDIPLGDGALLSVSAHRRTVSADVSGGAGDIDVVGNGVGASLAVDLADSVTEGAYADARVSATSYSARLSSGRRGSLQRDADGVGHAVSLEAGRRMAWGEGALGETTLTPRALFLYSRVDMDAFTDSVGARVSLKEGVAKTGRAGLRVEAVDRPGGSLLFASVDVEREFAPETRVRVSGFPLESESESTRVRAELGGALEWGEGAWALQAAARYASGADDYGGGVSLRMRF